jgi:murein DD-endopeptidase MepM/ murein hydrolase activator NlpD
VRPLVFGPMRTRCIGAVLVATLACGSEPPTTETPAVALPAPPASSAGEATAHALPGLADEPQDASSGGAASKASGPEPGGPDPEAPDPEGWIRGEVQPGESLARILGRHDVTPGDVARIATALTPIMDPAAIQPGQAWALQVDAASAWTRLQLRPSAVRTIEVVRDDTGAPRAEIVDAPTELRLHDVSATLESSLWAAVTDAGEDPALVAQLVELLASQIDFFTDPREGDRIAAVVEKRYLEGELVGYGRVLAVVYEGGVGRVDGVAWTTPGASEPAHWTFDGGSLDRTLLKSPLKFARVSSGFNAKRMHPVLHRVKGHWGIDYAAPTGTPVWAAADGEIVKRAPAGSAGNLVVLKHDGGFQTYYMHLDRFADGQKAGQRVKQKQVIGYVGTTGRSTGPHLHFGVKRAGKWVDLALVRSIERPGVPAKHRARFRRDTEELRTRVQALLGDPKPSE